MKKPARKASRITLRLQKANQAGLQAAAEAAGMSLATWARETLAQAARDARLAAEIDALRVQLAAFRAGALDRDYFIQVSQHLDKKLNALLAHLKIQMPGE